MIVYLTTNLINGKKYIGMDSRNNPNYLGSGLLILKSIEKYGRKNFKKDILEYCNSIEELELRETYWINYYDALNNPDFYNLEDIRKRGTDPLKNKSDEEKKLIYKKRGDSQRGKPKFKNRKPKPEYFKIAQKERFKNRGPKSEESKRKQSLTTKGKKQNQKVLTWEQSLNSKTLIPVLQYDLEGNFIQEFPSIVSAKKFLGKTGGLNEHIKGVKNSRTCMGFQWKPKTENFPLKIDSVKPIEYSNRKKYKIPIMLDNIKYESKQDCINKLNITSSKLRKLNYKKL